MRKKERYMSDKAFGVLEESLDQALQHARGERKDLRVTTGQEVVRRINQSAPLKLRVLKKIDSLSDEQLTSMDSYIAFLKFQEKQTSTKAKAA
jgi:hypothetical protein